MRTPLRLRSSPDRRSTLLNDEGREDTDGSIRQQFALPPSVVHAASFHSQTAHHGNHFAFVECQLPLWEDKRWQWPVLRLHLPLAAVPLARPLREWHPDDLCCPRCYYSAADVGNCRNAAAVYGELQLFTIVFYVLQIAKLLLLLLLLLHFFFNEPQIINSLI